MGTNIIMAIEWVLFKAASRTLAPNPIVKYYMHYRYNINIVYT